MTRLRRPLHGERKFKAKRLARRLVRALRKNPNGLDGPLVLRAVVVGLATDDGLSERALAPDELLEWTSTALTMFARASVDLREADPAASDDATWALAQIGATAADVLDPARADVAALVGRVWEGAKV